MLPLIAGQRLWDGCREKIWHFCTAQAEPQNPHPIDGSYSDIELAPFSSDYEQMRHHKGIIGEGAFGRVEQYVSS